MRKGTLRKVGVWVILILTSIALIIPSVAVIWSIFNPIQQPIEINPEDITITTATPSVENGEQESSEDEQGVSIEVIDQDIDSGEESTEEETSNPETTEAESNAEAQTTIDTQTESDSEETAETTNTEAQ